MVTLLLVTGCGFGGTSMPDEIEITLPNGETLAATIGTGVPSLANSEWVVYRVSENGNRGGAVLTMVFNDEGGLDGFSNSTIASSVFGSEIVLDGQKHSTTQPNLDYAGSTYGAENASGLAFEARIKAYYSGILAAKATAVATAAFVEDDPDTMIGYFEFSSHATILQDTELGQQAEQEDNFDFIADRVTG